MDDGTPTFVFSAYAGDQWLPETVFTGKELSAHIQEMLADPAKAKMLDAGPNNTYGGAYVGFAVPMAKRGGPKTTLPKLEFPNQVKQPRGTGVPLLKD